MRPVRDRKEQLTKMFRQFDRDGNGFITLMEASNILQRDPFKFPPSKVLTLLKQFDKNSDGKLDIEEFAGFYAEAKAMSVDLIFLLVFFWRVRGPPFLPHPLPLPKCLAFPHDSLKYSTKITSPHCTVYGSDNS